MRYACDCVRIARERGGPGRTHARVRLSFRAGNPLEHDLTCGAPTLQHPGVAADGLTCRRSLVGVPATSGLASVRVLLRGRGGDVPREGAPGRPDRGR